MKKTHMLRCAQSTRYNVLVKYASARRFFGASPLSLFGQPATVFLSNPDIVNLNRQVIIEMCSQ